MRPLYVIIVVMLLLPFSAAGKGACSFNTRKKEKTTHSQFPVTEKRSAYFPDADCTPTVQLALVIVAFLIGIIEVSENVPLPIRSSLEVNSSQRQGFLRTVISPNAP